MSNVSFNWIRRVVMPALTISIALMLPSLPVSAGQTDSYTLPQQSYNQSRAREYKVYVPDNIQSPAPMVMALHGCKQTNNDVLNDWGLKAAADRYGFILVAPYITSYDGLRNQNCWGLSNTATKVPGKSRTCIRSRWQLKVTTPLIHSAAISQACHPAERWQLLPP